MARPRSNRPTDVELQILLVMWEAGDATVRDVYDGISAHRPTAYSSVATIMRIMVDKGWITMTKPRRPQQFTPAMTKDALGRLILADLATRLFDGSAVALIEQAVAIKKRTPAELSAMKAVIDRAG